MLAAGEMGQWWEIRVDFGMGKWRRVRGMRRQEVEEDEERWGKDKK